MPRYKKPDDAGLPSLQQHFLNLGLSQQETADAVNAIMSAMQDESQATDWSPDEDWDGMEIDEEGRRSMDGLDLDEGDNASTQTDNSDIEIDYTSGDMSDGKAAEEAAKLFGMTNLARIPITKEMIEEQFGSNNGAKIWTELVATSILERIVIPADLKGKKKGELKIFYEDQVGRGVQMYQRKHKISSSISQWGKYLPSTWFGVSQATPSPVRRRTKDQGGNGFHVCIDVSGSNGRLDNPNDNINACVTTAVALIEEARILEYPVSLYTNPNLVEGYPSGQPKEVNGLPNPLLEPYAKYPITVRQGFDYDKMTPIGKKTTIKLPTDVDPRFYHYQSTEYDTIIRQLTTQIQCIGSESPRKVFNRLMFDLKRAQKERKGAKQTVIWIADCTRVDEYLTCPSVFDGIKEVGEMWIFCVSDKRQEEMIKFFGEGKDDRRYGDHVTFIDIPSFKRGGSPDKIPQIIAEKLGLQFVSIKSENRLRKMV